MITLSIIADRGGGMVTGMAEAVRGVVEAVAANPIAEKHRSSAARALQPSRHGGLALNGDEFVELVCELAALDASLGWLTAAFNAGAAEVNTLPKGAADAVWGDDPNMLTTNTFQGDGELGRGLRLTGQWESVVGAEYADWLLLPAGNGSSRVLVPRSAVRLAPVGSPAGLSAAGIRDVTVSAFPVDERLVVHDPDDTPAVIAGAGVAAAVVGLRVAAIAKRRGVPVSQVLVDLPNVAAEEAQLIADAARDAIQDGRAAADRARNEFDMQVVAHARRTKGSDD
jgi:hypothetical protein